MKNPRNWLMAAAAIVLLAGACYIGHQLARFSAPDPDSKLKEEKRQLTVERDNLKREAKDHQKNAARYRLEAENLAKRQPQIIKQYEKMADHIDAMPVDRQYHLFTRQLHSLDSSIAAAR